MLARLVPTRREAALVCRSASLHEAKRRSSGTAAPQKEAAAAGEGIPLWAKASGTLLALGLLVTFHVAMISQRDQKEAFHREKIRSLEDEVVALKTRLKEVERARFLGKPMPAGRE
eukprot:TRINITY_DN111297_c0_g1_i1.p1 TRINITY_DN111297_c0_g1~~TRINITY_DN111297_c0_g1_i1.p1  ORF type:complete len:116 (+),score=24.74 TRINITY_DN111297_c0_g1_i1:41-388(+)